MKLAEQDLQDACAYIMDDICKSLYSEDYKEKGFHFDLRYTPTTVRQIVDTFIDWLKIRHKENKMKQEGKNE